MKQFSYEMTRSVAPHARPLGRLIREAAKFSSSVTLFSGAGSAAAVKLGDLLRLGIKGGSRIVVTVDGWDEEAAVAAIQNYVVANF